MKQGAIPENPLEAAALAVGLVTTPLLDTTLLLARTVLVAVKLGVFDALAMGPALPTTGNTRRDRAVDSVRALACEQMPC